MRRDARPVDARVVRRKILRCVEEAWTRNFFFQGLRGKQEFIWGNKVFYFIVVGLNLDFFRVLPLKRVSWGKNKEL